jgi:hypothetical protein
MNSPRVALVALLIAAEVVIAGMMIFVLHGNHRIFAAGYHGTAFAAAPVTPLAAGSSPHIYISDRESGVTIATSHDGLVHVIDQSNVHGAFWNSGNIPQLHVTRSSDGVRIERPDSTNDSIFGFMNRHIEVDVPSGASIEVAQCSGADVTGIQNDVSVVSQDGHISLSDIRGDVNMQSNDGSLHLNDVTANKLAASTDDGSVRAAGISVSGASPHALFHSKDGSVHVNGAFAAGGSYELSSDDGRIELGLASGADMTIAASTNDGSVTVDGQRYDSNSDGSAHTVRLGSGSASMRVATDDGSIHITTNGAI